MDLLQEIYFLRLRISLKIAKHQTYFLITALLPKIEIFSALNITFI